MECNKDEAMRAKQIAEEKFAEKDFAAAKKFVMKAQNLYPGLEGLAQMLEAFDVYIRAEKTNGMVDFYAVLGVTSSATDDAIRRQYRKLALMLHPDKNKTIGAEGAFQIVSEAWSTLSDKSKRAPYDEERSRQVYRQNATPTNQQRTAPSGANGSHNFRKQTAPMDSANKNTSPTNNSSQKKKLDTFWTICHICQTHYQYVRMYLNHNLVCSKCRETFFAIEVPPPASVASKKSTPGTTSQQKRPSNAKPANEETSASKGQDGGMKRNFDDQEKMASMKSTPGTTSQLKRPSNVQPASEETLASKRQDDQEKMVSKKFSPGTSSQQKRPSNVQPASEETLASKRQDGGMKRKFYDQEKMAGASFAEYLNFAKKRGGFEEFGVGGMKQSSFRFGVSMAANSLGHGFSGTTRLNRTNRLYGLGGLSQVETRSIFMEKASRNIDKKINSYGTNSMLKRAAKREKAQTEDKGTKRPDTSDQGSSKISLAKENIIAADNVSFTAVAAPNGNMTSESLSMSVPDPEFYDFDKDRTERSFEENQVWAGYDNDDGMPRYYGIIQSVLSRNPFKVQISWFNPKTNTELGPLNWVGSGFSKTCGVFRPGKPEVSDSLNSFSHMVWWTKGARGAICIFPRKGDVWALYQNWSPDWDELTPDDIIHKYDMVKVLEDYEEQQGVLVIPLVKVAGFKTVFRPHSDRSQIKRIPRGEMFRFSHQVPRHLLTDQEASGTLKGCMELDPAATPADLLRVIADAKQDVDEAAKCEMEPVDKDQRQNPME